MHLVIVYGIEISKLCFVRINWDKISQGDQLEFWQCFKWSLCTIENGEN
jgi:hypothetical protein